MCVLEAVTPLDLLLSLMAMICSFYYTLFFQLDSTISEDTEPFILVRRHVIILKVVPVRAIILHDRCLLLLPQGADAYLGRIIAKLQPRRDGDTDSSTGEETSKFEFHALEAILDTACFNLNAV